MAFVIYRLCIGLFLAAGIASAAETKITVSVIPVSPSGDVVDLDGTATIAVSVENDEDLQDLAVEIQFDGAVVGSPVALANTSRVPVGVDSSETRVVDAQTVRFFIDAAFTGDLVALAAGTGPVFTFQVTGLARGVSSLTYSGASAHLTTGGPAGSAGVVTTDGSIEVLGPGPIGFSPVSGSVLIGGSLITLTSTDATAIHYTTDGSLPTVGSPSVASGGTISVDGENAEIVAVNALAADGSNRQETGTASYIFDLPPTAAISAVSPDPRNVPVASVEIVFSEAVTGVNASDFSLTLDGGGDLLTGTETVLTVDGGVTWSVSDLETLTTGAGDYVFSLIAAGSGIADTDVAPTDFVDDVNDGWTTDLTAPIVDIDALTTNDQSPALTGSVNDAGAQVLVSILDADDNLVAGPLPAVLGVGQSWTIANDAFADLPEGLYDVLVTATDPAGNVGADVTTDELNVDLTAPTGAFVIESGDPAFVRVRNVTLIQSVEGASFMRFRNGGESFGAFEPYQATKNWVLTDGGGSDGDRTVFGEFRDLAGNVLGSGDSLFDGVVLDRKMPSSAPSTVGFVGPEIWPGQVFGTASDALSGVSTVQVRVRREPTGPFWNGTSWQATEVWLAATGTLNWSLALPSSALTDQATYQLASQATDAAGNVEATASLSLFTYDASAPTGVFVIGSNNPGYVTSTTVTLELDGILGASEMRFRNAGGTFSAWTNFPVADPKTAVMTLDDADGTRRVEAQFRDLQQNVFETFAEVVLDRSKPTSSPATNGGYGTDAGWPDQIAGTAGDLPSGVAMVEVQLHRTSDNKYWNGSNWISNANTFNLTTGTDNWAFPVAFSVISEKGDGESYIVRSRATDLAENIQTDLGSSSFIYDSNIPAGGFVVESVLSGVIYTRSTNVSLKSSVASVTGGSLTMQFRNSGGAYSGFVAYNPTVATWDLDDDGAGGSLGVADGVVTVDAQYKDSLNDLVLSTSDAIVLDRIGPTNSISSVVHTNRYGPATWPDLIAGNAGDATSGVAKVEISIQELTGFQYWTGATFESGTVDFQDAIGTGSWSYPLVSGVLSNGSFEIIMRTTDLAGNQTISSPVRFVYDSLPPAGLFSVVEGAYTTDLDVNLSNTVVQPNAVADPTAIEMRFRNEGGSFGSWIAHSAGATTFALTGSDGSKRVYAEFRDGVQNVLALFADIRLDTAPPESSVSTTGILGPNGWNNIQGTATDGGSGVASVSVRIQRSSDLGYWDGDSWEAGETLLPAIVSGSDWSYVLSPNDLTHQDSYLVDSVAVDHAGLSQLGRGEGGFTFDSVAPVSQPTLPVKYGVDTWTGTVVGTASDGGSGVDKVEILFGRQAPGAPVGQVWGGSGWLGFGNQAWFDASGTTGWSFPFLISNLDDGYTYFMLTRATDGAGNLENAGFEFDSFVYDAVRPAVTVTSPEASPSKNTLFSYVVTFDDTVTGFEESDLVVSNGTIDSFSETVAGSKWTVSVVPTDDGDVIVTVPAGVAVDDAGNGNVVGQGTVKFDDTPPDVNIARLPDQDLHNDDYQLTVTASDGTVAYSLDGADFAPYTGAVTVAAGGHHTFDARSTDAAGNIGDAVQVTFEIDLTAPAVTIGRVPDRDMHNDDYELTVDVSDGTIEYNLNGAGFVAYTGPVTVSSERVHTFDARSTDAAGNVGNATQATFEIDLKTPIVTIARNPDQDLHNDDYLLTVNTEVGASVEYSVDGGENYLPYSQPVTISAEADHTFDARATDAAGNVGNATTATFKIDLTAPTVTILRAPDSDLHNDDYLLTVDGGDGVTVEYSLDEGSNWQAYPVEGVTVSAERTHTFDARSTDAAGNVGAATQVNFEIDLTPPDVTIGRTPDQDLHNGNYVLTVGSEAGASLEYSVDGGSNYLAYTGPVTVSVEGGHTFDAQATDAAGNVGQATQATFRIDLTAPDITFSAVPDFSSSVDVTVTIVSDGGEAISYTIDGGDPVSYVNPFVVSAKGSHTIEATATDPAGNLGMKTQNVQVTYAIAGNVTYDGGEAGDAWLEIYDSTSRALIDAVEVVGGNGTYELAVSSLGTYEMRAFLDLDGGDAYEVSEPADLDSHESVVVAGDESNLDFILADWALTVPVGKGWNLLSVPGDALAGDQFGDVWAGSGPSVLGFDASKRRLQRPDAVEPLTAYWIFYPTDQALRIRGHYSVAEQPLLVRGWNLVGVRLPTVVGNLSAAKAVWQYNGRRLVRMRDADTMLPGNGYWIHSLSGTSQ